MIFKPRNLHHPPHGRFDGVIYFGAPNVAQPIAPLCWDETLLVSMFWDSVTAMWVQLPVSDAQLSANVPLMTAGVLPAVDGSLLTNLPGVAPSNLISGMVTLDGAGQGSVVNAGTGFLAGVWRQGQGSVGLVTLAVFGGGSFMFESSAGASDAGHDIYYVGF